jgi:S1-C subfamily serine protease
MNGRKSNRTPLYSHSSRVRPPDVDPPQSVPAQPGARPARAAAGTAATALPSATPDAASAAPPQRRRGLALPAWGWALAGALLLGGPAVLWEASRPPAQVLTQKHIDAAVRKALETQPLPSPAAKAYEKVRGAVVRVVGLDDDGPADGAAPGNGAAKPDPGKKAVAGDSHGHGSEVGVGSGVVIVDSGLILTNLHVVSGAKRVQVVFADGLESEATVVNVMPENDLAVLRAQRIPDDLQAATLRSTADLKPGERVTAVGFPFGIGPTVSAGVVSGLKREFRSPEGKQVLSNLIQFDAMANPGSSGGPLVTDDGEVVGIVTAILNPVQQRFFVGIGFAVPIENAAGGAGLPPF